MGGISEHCLLHLTVLGDFIKLLYIKPRFVCTKPILVSLKHALRRLDQRLKVDSAYVGKLDQCPVDSTGVGWVG